MSEVYRHIYQNSQGGKTYCPLESSARIFGNGTPLLARQVSSKYGEMSARQVVKDLGENHGRHLSSDYVQHLSARVGILIAEKESSWSYVLPLKQSDVHIISIGRDGTTMPIRGEGYRETMNGTISFYDESGGILHSIYLAQAPQYGKSTFDGRFAAEIQRIQAMFPRVSYVGLADGAKDNWTFLASYVDYSILDYWHVCEYITKASKACSRSKYEQKQWAAAKRTQLLTEPSAATRILTEMKTFRRKRKIGKKVKEGLEQVITYFQNHIHQMEYHHYQQGNLPIGSGVTEAACKVIVKQRTNQSGMRWNIDSVQKVLDIRAINRTHKRWEQFWNHVDVIGIAA